MRAVRIYQITTHSMYLLQTGWMQFCLCRKLHLPQRILQRHLGRLYAAKQNQRDVRQAWWQFGLLRIPIRHKLQLPRMYKELRLYRQHWRRWQTHRQTWKPPFQSWDIWLMLQQQVIWHWGEACTSEGFVHLQTLIRFHQSVSFQSWYFLSHQLRSNYNPILN